MNMSLGSTNCINLRFCSSDICHMKEFTRLALFTLKLERFRIPSDTDYRFERLRRKCRQCMSTNPEHLYNLLPRTLFLQVQVILQLWHLLFFSTRCLKRLNRLFLHQLNFPDRRRRCNLCVEPGDRAMLSQQCQRHTNLKFNPFTVNIINNWSMFVHLNIGRHIHLVGIKLIHLMLNSNGCHKQWHIFQRFL